MVRDLVVPIGDRFVVALLFETDRAPYVVKTSEFGKRVGVSIASEVPWREGTAVRSARREDLIRILVPALRTPEVSILSCFVDCRFRKNAFSWECRAELYIVPATRERLVIPHHLCNVFAAIAPFETVTFETEFRLRPSPISVGRRMMKIGHQEVEPLPDGQPSKTIYSSVTETIIDGPGLAILEGHGRSAPIGDGIAGQGTFGAELPLARSDRRVRLDERIRRIRTDENGMRWALESDTAIAEPTPSP